MSKILKMCTAVAMLAWLSSSCANNGDVILNNLLVVKNASSVNTYKSDGGNRLQVSYELKLDYPSLAITDTEYNKLKKQGWIKCLGSSSEWASHSDASQNDGETVHQYISYWAKNGKLLTIAMKYYSFSNKGGSKLKNPDNRTQHVLLLLDNYGDLSEVQKRLDISCQ